MLVGTKDGWRQLAKEARGARGVPAQAIGVPARASSKRWLTPRQWLLCIQSNLESAVENSRAWC